MERSIVTAELRLQIITSTKCDRNEHLNDVQEFLQLDADLSDRAYFDSLLNLPYEKVMEILKSHVLYNGKR